MKYRILSLLFAAVMVVTGAIYLSAGSTSLTFVLPLLTVCLWIISVLQVLELREAGGRGIITLLPAIAMGLAATATTLATFAYYAGI